MRILPRLPRLACAAAALLLAACTDSAPLTPRPPAPAPIAVRQLDCTASTVQRTVRCGGAGAAWRGDVHVGGQGTYVQLSSSNVAYNAVSGTFSFDVTVQNLIPQAMGTTDGTTPSGTGVRIYFHTPPHATAGTVLPTDSLVSGYDGIATFDAPNQRYYQYAGSALGGDGILSQNETSSAKAWSIHVPATVTTFAFQVLVSTEVPHPGGYVDVTPAADTATAGATVPLAAQVRSAVGDPIAGQTVTWGTSDASVATVDGSGVVTAVGPGTVTITGTSGARSGTATLAICPSLAVGGVYQVSAAGLCLSGGASGAEYTVVAQNQGTAVATGYSLTGSGITPVVGPPSPDRIAGPGGLRVPLGPVADAAFHARLMEQGRAMPARLGLRPLPGRRQGPHANVVPGVPAVGLVMNLNVGLGYCTPVAIHAARVKAVGTHVIVMEDTANPAGGFSTAQYDSIAATFDTLSYPAVTGAFGAPFDIDSNGRVIALFTAAVNDLTPAGSPSYVGGFFYSRDLYPTTACPGSNQGEMFYLLAPDPTGEHGNVRSVSFARTAALSTLGHELQHLVNASRRTYGAGGPYELEQVWLNEGLSHVAEEEVYFASSHHAAGENLGLSQIAATQAQQESFFSFMEPNVGRLRQWLLRPDTAGPFRDADNLAIRGAAWSFLRYASDRRGGSSAAFWSALAFSPDTGMTNLANRLGTDPKPWFRDWAGAIYADDAVAGAPAALAMPSWNLRSILAGLDYDPGPACTCAYELGVRKPANGVATAFTLAAGGGTGYVRLRVPTSGFAGVAATAPTSALTVTVLRTK